MSPWGWKPPAPEEPDEFCPANTGPYYSGCVDSRLRFPTTDYPNRTIASFSGDGQGSSCTGTLVGPRHVITAAHCVYQGGNTWHDFHVIPGRNGTQKPFGSTLMSDTQGLNTGFRWYWVPAALVGSYPDWYSGLDIAILIIPQRLGDQTGWMGLGALTESYLSAAWTRNRGYPSQPGSHVGFHCSQVEGALYGDINVCNVGGYDHYDPDGWARLADHSCDNSSGHSGSAIFAWVYDSSLQANVPVVTAIVSHHAAFANEFDCANNPRPYQATRITPEYFNQFLFMRSWKP